MLGGYECFGKSLDPKLIPWEPKKDQKPLTQEFCNYTKYMYTFN